MPGVPEVGRDPREPEIIELRPVRNSSRSAPRIPVFRSTAAPLPNPAVEVLFKLGLA